MNRLFLIIILLLSLKTCNLTYSQNKWHKLEVRHPVSADSLSTIQVNKVMFYRDPLSLGYYNLADSTYTPNWYNAFCASHNLEFFNNNAREAIKYYSEKHSISLDILESRTNQVILTGGLKSYFRKRPTETYMYIFSEIWFTYKVSGQKYVLIQGCNSDHPLKNLRFKEPAGAKNQRNERVDTVKVRDNAGNVINSVRTSLIFIDENDTLKWTDQMLAQDLFTEGKFSIDSDLANFKNMLYRSPVYIQSEIENGKRVFKTMERSKEGRKMRSKSDRP